VPDRSVSKRLDFDRIFLGFQEGEEMRLVRNVERIDEKVGLDYLFRNCLFFNFVAGPRLVAAVFGFKLTLTRIGISG